MVESAAGIVPTGHSERAAQEPTTGGMTTLGGSSVALAVVVAAACGQAPRQAATSVPAADVVPVYQEPRHRLVFDSPLVRVLDVRLPPGYNRLPCLRRPHGRDSCPRRPNLDPNRRRGAPSPVATPQATPYVFDTGRRPCPTRTAWRMRTRFQCTTLWPSGWRDPGRHVLRNDGSARIVSYGIDWR